MHVLVVELGQDKPLIKEQSNLKVLYALRYKNSLQIPLYKGQKDGIPSVGGSTHPQLPMFWATACQTIATLPT